MKFAVIDVAEVNVTVDASYQIPVAVLIACTLGMAVKFPPAITTFVASLVIIFGVKLEMVGLVSQTVTEPPKATADPFIVIAPVPTKAELGIFEIVLLEPLIVLFVKVCVAEF